MTVPCFLCSKRYSHKLNQTGSMYNIPECVIDGYNLKKPGHDVTTALELNRLAYKTLVEGYLTSADDEILESHIPYFYDDYYDRIPGCFMEDGILKENFYKLVC